MHNDEKSGFTFWVAQPPGLENLRLLAACGGVAEPWLDLRYGSSAYRKGLIRRAARSNLAGLTCAASIHERHTLAMLRDAQPPGSRVVLCDLADDERQAAVTAKDLRSVGLLVGVEADGRLAARAALCVGADFVVGAGSEAGGFVSSRTALILAQELLDELTIPVILRADVGPLGAAALYAAGCAGIVLGSQLLLTPESPCDEGLRERLASASPADPQIVGDLVERAFRALSVGEPGLMQELRGRERHAYLHSPSESARRVAFAEHLLPVAEPGFAGEFLPVGQGVLFAQRFADEGLSAPEVVESYREALGAAITRLRRHWPFGAGSALAEHHGVELPVVQGPMAVVTAGAGLPAAVAQAGGMPFVAMAGTEGELARERIQAARSELGDHPFGVGLIAFGEQQGDVERTVLAERPSCVTVAGGTPGRVLQFQDRGIDCYWHTPTPTHLRQALEAGIRGVILEGHEAGGHVGKLGSLVLWESATLELLDAGSDRLAAQRVLLAGGIGTSRSALMAGVICAPLAQKGVACGLQLGTAYMLTDEAVECGAVAEACRHMLQMAERTVVTGRSLHLPARWAYGEAVDALVDAEAEALVAHGATPQARRQMEQTGLKHLQKALSGAIGKPPPACMCGAAVSCLPGVSTVAELHEAVTAGAAKLAGRLQHPAESGDALQDAVAIVGMGCLFPGAASPEEFWQNIINRVSAIGEVPRERWDVDIFYDPAHRSADKSMSKLGAFIKGFQKDPMKFHIPPVAADSIDRGQFAALEVARQALADAGLLERSFSRERTGVILGNSMGGELSVEYGVLIYRHDFVERLRRTPAFQQLPPEARDALAEQAARAIAEDKPEITEDSCAGTLGSVFAGRICNQFNLGGVSYTLDGACASSLAAVNAAVRGLRSGEFDLVLAGGIEARMDPTSYVMFSSLGVLSDTGSFPFDDRADGFVMAEGMGMVALKRYADALRDGDRIYAIIRAIGSSSDGSARSVTAPHVPGQVAAMRRAYLDATFSPADIDLVEAHGTATQTGDPTELASLTEVFGPHVEDPGSIALGSVKSMVGHMKTAAGVAGLIKVAMALHHRVLPPTMNCERPRSDYDWGSSPFRLNTEPREWQSDGRPRRGAVNAFGFGGVNFHVVLEQPPNVDATAKPAQALPARLFLFREQDRDGLRRAVAAFESEADGSLQSFEHGAQQAYERCGEGQHSLAIVAADGEDLRQKLRMAARALAEDERGEFTQASGLYYGCRPLERGAVAFLYPGQGTQYVGMARGLPSAFPFLAPTFEGVEDTARCWTGHGMLETLLAADGVGEERREQLAEMLVRTDYNHPALLAMWAAIGAFLRRAGVHPDMAAGHSVGEYGALHAGGVFDLKWASATICQRGAQAQKACFGSGAMAAVGAPAQAVQPVLDEVDGLVVLANKNCPAQSVISGEPDAVRAALAAFERQGFRCSPLPVSSAFHTAMMAPCVTPFRRALEHLPLRPPRIAVECNLSGTAYPSHDDRFAETVRDALAEHLVSPVEFESNIRDLYKRGARLFLEVGPGSVLSSFADSTLAELEHWTFPTNLRAVAPPLQLLHTLGYCHARGLQVDLPAVLPGWQRPLVRSERRTEARLPSPPAEPSPASAPADTFGQALEGAEPETVERYLSEREGFLRAMLHSMVRLDFEHYAGAPAPRPEDDNLRDEIVEVFSRRTGYPTEVIDPDLDLEAELGLDSIKRTEILDELEQRYGVRLRGRGDVAARHDLSTVRGVIGVFAELTGGEATPREREAAQQSDSAEWNTDCHRLVCELRPAPLQKAAGSMLQGQRVMLLQRGDARTQVVSDRLQALGASVSRLDLAEDAAPLAVEADVVVDLTCWPLDSVAAPVNVAAWWAEVESHAAASLGVVQRMVKAMQGRERRCRWLVVSPLGGDLGAGEAPQGSSPAGITLALTRCLFADHPDLFDMLYVDLEPDAELSRVAEIVADELSAPAGHPEIGYPGGERCEIRWHVADSRLRSAPPLGPEAVVLAVGGARGITARMCAALAGHTGARFVIVGRSAVDESEPTADPPITFEAARQSVLEEWQAEGKSTVPVRMNREAWSRVWADERRRNLAALRGQAAEVTYRRCDVADGELTRQLIRDIYEQYGRLDLVINGAGALVEKSVEDLEPEQFLAGLRPKALGTANLLAALEGRDLPVFANVSSVVGRWGYMGMAPYSTGHVIASLLVAAARGRRPGRWLNLLYGPWLKVGMTRLGETIERVRASGGAFVAEADGTDYFLAELQGDHAVTTAFRGMESFGVMLAGAGPGHSMLDSLSVDVRGAAHGSRLFDPARDRCAAEHIVMAEPVLPGVVLVEMMAQTASALADAALEVREVREVRFLRPVRFPRGEPRKVMTRALRAEGRDDMVEAELYTFYKPLSAEAPEQVVHATCSVVFGRRGAPPPPLLPSIKHALGEAEMPVQRLWETDAASGRRELFRNIDSISSTRRDGANGVAAVPGPCDEMRQPVCGDLVRLDGLLYVATLPDLVYDGCDAHYVEGVRSIEFFSGEEDTVTRQCRTRMTGRDGRRLTNYIEGIGTDGRVRERIRGAISTRGYDDGFEPLDDPIFRELRDHPQRAELAGVLGLNGRLTLAEVQVLPAWRAEGEAVDEAVGHWLSGEEAAELAQMDHPKRRSEWLAGRIAAKEAIRSLADYRFPVRDVAVLRGADGAPEPVVPAEGEAPFVSIAHSAERAVACACALRAVGIDVERAAPDIARLRERFCTQQEVRLLQQSLDGDESVAMMHLWVAKEAALKVLGPAAHTMGELRAEGASLDAGRLVCALKADRAALRTVSFCSEGYFYALATSLERNI